MIVGMEYVWNEWQGEKEAAYGEQRNQCQGFYRPGACLGGAAGLMLVVMYAPRTEHINGQMLASCSNRRGRRPGDPLDARTISGLAGCPACSPYSIATDHWIPAVPLFTLHSALLTAIRRNIPPPR